MMPPSLFLDSGVEQGVLVLPEMAPCPSSKPNCNHNLSLH